MKCSLSGNRFPVKPGPQPANQIKHSADEQLAQTLRPRRQIRSDNFIGRLFDRHGSAILEALRLLQRGRV